jgi:large subunit ribosomal protein L15
MNLSDARRIRVPRTQRKRVGRGWGSGMGKTSTRGEKGAGRRSGTKFRTRFEGGQMPLYRRLPKKGFTNARFRVSYSVVNAGDLEGAFEAGAKVDLEALRGARLVPKNAKRLKILGDGELEKALHVTADAASAGARTKIEAAGGTLTLPTPAAEELTPREVARVGKPRKAAPPPVEKVAPTGEAAPSKKKEKKEKGEASAAGSEGPPPAKAEKKEKGGKAKGGKGAEGGGDA